MMVVHRGPPAPVMGCTNINWFETNGYRGAPFLDPGITNNTLLLPWPPNNHGKKAFAGLAYAPKAKLLPTLQLAANCHMGQVGVAPTSL
ncbi:hypothetical protein V6N13_076860 [Hibiscus sabdariffa]|uniref:Uncharacterized protein n=1 Tax=Hibiscus sabdariffa TaxID=183260 RepID=A0ABR2CM41_9ROSI